MNVPRSHLPSHWRRRHGLIWLLAMLLAMAVVLLMFSSSAAACPSCKAALSSNEGRQGDLVGGFMWSILFMLSMPFALVGSFSAYMYVLVRKARGQRPAAPVIPPGVATRPPADSDGPSAI